MRMHPRIRQAVLVSSALLLAACANNPESIRAAGVSTLSGDGIAGAVDGSLIVPDQNNRAIRRVGMDGTVVTLAGFGKAGFADGKGREAQFNNPTGAVAAADGSVYVADRNNHRLRRIAVDGVVTTLAGNADASFVDGPLAVARFNRPLDVVERDGRLFASEENNHRVRIVAK